MHLTTEPYHWPEYFYLGDGQEKRGSALKGCLRRARDHHTDSWQSQLVVNARAEDAVLLGPALLGITWASGVWGYCVMPGTEQATCEDVPQPLYISPALGLCIFRVIVPTQGYKNCTLQVERTIAQNTEYMLYVEMSRSVPQCHMVSNTPALLLSNPRAQSQK